MVLIMMI